MNSYEFGYVLNEFGFLGMAKTLRSVYLGVTRIPTKYPYYNIRKGNGWVRVAQVGLEAALVSRVPSLLEFYRGFGTNFHSGEGRLTQHLLPPLWKNFRFGRQGRY